MDTIRRLTFVECVITQLSVCKTEIELDLLQWICTRVFYNTHITDTFTMSYKEQARIFEISHSLASPEQGFVFLVNFFSTPRSMSPLTPVEAADYFVDAKDNQVVNFLFGICKLYTEWRKVNAVCQSAILCIESVMLAEANRSMPRDSNDIEPARLYIAKQFIKHRRSHDLTHFNICVCINLVNTLLGYRAGHINDSAVKALKTFTSNQPCRKIAELAKLIDKLAKKYNLYFKSDICRNQLAYLFVLSRQNFWIFEDLIKLFSVKERHLNSSI